MTKALKEGDEEETCPPGRSQSRVMGSRTVPLLRVGDSCQYSTDCVTDQDCGGGKVGNCSLCYFFICLVHLRARVSAWSPTLLSTGLDSVSVMMDGRLKLVRHYGTFSKHVQITFLYIFDICFQGLHCDQSYQWEGGKSAKDYQREDYKVEQFTVFT